MVRVLIFTACIAFALTVEAKESAPTYLSGSQPDLIFLKPVEKYLMKAYCRLGFRVNFIGISNARNIKMAEQGELDALTVRTNEVAANIKSMIAVPVPIVEGNFTLYCQLNMPCTEEVLDSTKTIVGTLNGTNLTSLYMKNRRASVYKITSGDQLVYMFNKGRLDYILTFELAGMNAFSFKTNENFQKHLIQKVQGFHLIHKKHKQILPQLTQSLALTIDELGPVSIAIQQFREQLKRVDH